MASHRPSLSCQLHFAAHRTICFLFTRLTAKRPVIQINSGALELTVLSRVNHCCQLIYLSRKEDYRVEGMIKETVPIIQARFEK